MKKPVIAAMSLWAAITSALTLAASLLVIALPEMRLPSVRALLMLLVVVISAESLWRLKRANGLSTSLAELRQHLPGRTPFSESLSQIATIVTVFTVLLAF
jgi:hypothetical protein